MSTNQEKVVSELPQVQALSSDLVVVVVANSAASPAITYTTGLTSISSLPLASGNTPANSTALTVPRGTVWTDGSYLYVATSDNVLKRVALSSF